jgi:hypothetical protein
MNDVSGSRTVVLDDETADLRWLGRARTPVGYDNLPETREVQIDPGRAGSSLLVAVWVGKSPA